MPFIQHDHYLGIYSGEQINNSCNCSNDIILENSNSLASFYRSKRRQFLELVSEIGEEYRLSIINEEMRIKLENLKNNSPEIFKLLIKNKINDKFNIFNVYENDSLLQVSYLKFLKILEEKYKRIELIKSVEIKWMKDYNTFIEFYQILNNTNIIKSDFLRFKQFFSLTNNIEFNSNLFETVAIFYELAENQYITELTLDSMIDNNKIISSNGRVNGIINLDRKKYVQNKSKYKDDFSDNSIRQDVYKALNKFGINLKQKKIMFENAKA